MNTKKVIGTKVKKLWDFPLIIYGGSGRVFTKHFMNMVMILEPNVLALFCFLVYQAEQDNTIKYSSKILRQYDTAVKMLLKRYETKKYLRTSEPTARKYFIKLIETGFLLPTLNPKIFLINPCIAYSKWFLKPDFYKKWEREYLKKDLSKLPALSQEFINHIAEKYK